MNPHKRVLLSGLNGFKPNSGDESEAKLPASGKKFDGRLAPLSSRESELMYTIQQAFDNGCLDVLSERERGCFQDHIITGDPLDTVAKRYGIKKSTVENYIQRASLKIRNWIDENE